MRKLRSFLANRIATFLQKPFMRYGILLPLVKLLSPDADERILSLAMEFAGHTTGGDYLEFGVWKGRSFTKAFHLWDRFMRRKGKLTGMRFYAFDSFQGLPEITASEDCSTGEFKKGDYAFTEKQFRGVLQSRGVDIGRVTIVPGWYDQTLNEHTKRVLPIKKASIVFIDCDLYESTVPVLRFITDYIVDGTILIFDDWYCFGGRPDRGEQKAFSEWLARNPTIKAVPWHSTSWKSQSFILYRT